MPDYSAYDIRNMAHARLLTAAPDLLAVCADLVESAEYWSDYEVPCGIVDRLNAAIAKAGGTALRTPDRCQWVKDGEQWNTACGDFHNTSDNNMVFCPYCGRPITTESVDA